jgi:hypothetical protein
MRKTKSRVDNQCYNASVSMYVVFAVVAPNAVAGVATSLGNGTQARLGSYSCFSQLLSRKPPKMTILRISTYATIFGHFLPFGELITGRQLMLLIFFSCIGFRSVYSRRTVWMLRDEPEGRGRSQHSIVPCNVESRRRCELRNPFHQFHRLIDYMRRSVAPTALELVQKPAVRQKRKRSGTRSSVDFPISCNSWSVKILLLLIDFGAPFNMEDSSAFPALTNWSASISAAVSGRVF